jgi:hypothetical protein
VKGFNMTTSSIIGILMVTLLGVGCSSASSSGKSGGTGGNSGIVLGAGATGADAALSANGLAPLSADRAAQLTAAACQGWSAEPEGGPAVVEFQIDTTQSMTETNWPSTHGQSKWAALQAAMPQAFAALPSTWAVGLSFFAKPLTGCYQGSQAVPIAPLTDQQRTALNNAVAAKTPGGYTPTEAAYVFALGQIQAYSGSAGKRYIVLETDGVPTVNRDGCTVAGQGNSIAISPQEYSHVVATVGSDTASTGVKTFVVGVPGSEDPQGASYDPMYELSLIAQAGGTAKAGCTASSGTVTPNGVNPRGTYCHYDMTQATDFATALVQTIGTIAGQVVSCNYQVPPAPAGQSIDPAKVNMIYDDGSGNKYLVEKDPNANCQVGWHYTDATNQNIEICSTTCSLLQQNPLASISLTFGCSTVEVPA